MSTDVSALRHAVTVKTPHGLHLGPCSIVAKLAIQFSSCTILICKDDTRADARRILDLMTLGAGPGTQLQLEISGEDAATAMARFVDLFDGDFSLPDSNGA